CFGATIVAGLALLGFYIVGSDTRVEGPLLAICLGGLGAGIVIWSHDLLDAKVVVEQRGTIASDPEAGEMLRETLAEEGGITRRKALLGLLLGAFGALAAALAIPIFSLGPVPGRQLFETSWKSGLRLVGLDGKPVTVDQIPVGGIQTVFPENAVGVSDSQTVLINVGPGLLQLAPERSAGAPDGYVAYSKLCTHAGCPVGLYLADQHTLLCPCHQSEFDVLRGAVPIGGPAGRALPQLPIQLQPDGTFVALGDYTEPVGPSFWNVHS
ncbi:MAG TPA: Rieske 2Fe-2S domain-containing protein, partial [Candidatus Limnocylindrales bacterium]